MPSYDFKCRKCETISEYILSMAKSSEPQICLDCGSEDTMRIITSCNFILKGDDFSGKNIKVNRQMLKKREVVGYKQEWKRREEIPKLVPNVNGEEVKDWNDAKKLASSLGKETEGYEKRIQQNINDNKKIVKG